MLKAASLSDRKFHFFISGLAAKIVYALGHAEAEFLPGVNCKNVASGNCYWQGLGPRLIIDRRKLNMVILFSI